MKLLNENLVKVAQVHQPVDVGGFITKKTLSADNMPGLKMWLTELGLIMKHRNTVAVIPHANVAIAIFEKDTFIEEEKPKLEKKDK